MHTQETNLKTQRSNINRVDPIVWVILCCFFLTVSIGCGNKDSVKESAFDEAPKQKKTVELEPLTLLVVGDEELGNRTKRQWSARRDGTLIIRNVDVQAFIDSDFSIDADVDVLVYPPSMMGELVCKNRLEKMPRDFWESDEFNKNSLLRHFRTTIVRYQGDVWGVPLGSPNFALLGNRKLFEKMDAELPVSWESLEKTLNKIAKSDSELPPKIDMPLAKGWAANSLLVHVASSIRNRGKLSTVFDRRTMEPLITGKPFVEALERIKNTATERSLELDPKKTFELANSGASSLAIAWPALGFLSDSESGEGATDNVLMVRSVPGSTRWYDHKADIWHVRSKDDDVHVDLIGHAGLVASVVAGSANDQAAWRFLQWWPSPQISLLTLTESPTVGPFRASQLGDMSRWTGDTLSVDVADEYADVIAANHERSLNLMFPRVLAQHEYLDALDQTVRDFVAGTGTAEAALKNLVSQWEAITDRIGRKEQAVQLRKESGS
ncbi:MAG: hypothetical protein AB8B55_18755 [Mariniblastus sp.]